MSKSVLVIDTPENCKICNYHKREYVHYCLIENATIDDASKKPDWCPLKPLPEKSTIENDMTDYQCGLVDGWNACIDEITGGE